MKRVLLTADLVRAGFRRLPWVTALLGLGLIALGFLSRLDRPPELRAVQDLYPLFEMGYPLIGIFLAAGLGAREAEEGTAETILTYPAGYPRLVLTRWLAMATVSTAAAALGTAAWYRWYMSGNWQPLFLASLAPTLLLSGAALLGGAITRSTLAGALVGLAWWSGESILKQITGQCYLLFASACSGLGPGFVHGRLTIIAASFAFPLLAAAWVTNPERVYRGR